ncbi:MAG TPA: ATP-grasp domain-containing protein [Roseiflexaceae bacterium]|nr:ATP-grasp domain-containing protein [Roseiflexaceae bacterium]
MLVVFSEADATPSTTINGRELRAISEAARLLGCRVHPIPADFNVCGTAEAALAYLPAFEPAVPGVWVGFIPTPERYAALYAAAQAHGVALLHTPEQHQTAMEFDRFYPLLGELTPASAVARTVEEALAAGTRLGYPLFVKGAVKSSKEQGWSACVAPDSAALERLASDLLARPGRSRGRVVLRQLAELRQSGAAPGGFPLGREYRVFVYAGNVLASGYYWDEHADPFPLTSADRRAQTELALEATRRVGAPFLAVDLAQRADGAWIVIEVGDGQFSGLSHVPVLELWSRLLEQVDPPLGR